MKAIEFIYQDTKINFLLGNEKNVMINANEMAKLFNKRVDVFLKAEPTKQFIKILELPPVGVSSEKFTREEIIKTNYRHGTYFNRILALKFAAWLDPVFEVWVFSKIEDILFSGAKKVAEKIKDEQTKKQELADLVLKAKQLNIPEVNSLLTGLDELKRISYEKKKAMREFSEQYRLF